jgi:small conductance mechanosensitive channel
MASRGNIGISRLHRVADLELDCPSMQAAAIMPEQPMISHGVTHRLIRWVCLLVFLLACSVPGSIAYAQDERVTVRIDGRAVMRVGPVDDLEAVDRARRIERRIATLLENPEAIALPVIEPPPTDDPEDTRERVITVSGVEIVTVTEADAEDNLTTVSALAMQWAQALSDTLQFAVERRQTGWGGVFVANVRGAIENAFGQLLESLSTIIPGALAALLVIALFWLAATAVRWLVVATLCRLSTEPTIQNLIKQIAYYAVWVIGIIVAIDALGFDPEAVATGLGLTGLALGFALRDIISNFVSGLLILTLRPFRIGDQILVGDTEGSVERIELRATQILTYDGRRVLVPNGDVFTSIVTNNTASPMRRAGVELYIGYDVDLERALAIIHDAAQEAPGVLNDRPVVVLVREMGPDNILIEVRIWTDSRRADFLATMSAVRRSIVAALKEAGISLPDPSIRNLVPHHPDKWQAALGREELHDERLRSRS